MLKKLFAILIKVAVIIIGINLIIYVFQILGLGDLFGSSFDRYEKEGGSLFIEGPDALDPLDNNEPLFGPEKTDIEPIIEVPETRSN